MRVLKVTNMYPTEERPHFGIFVRQETESLRRLGIEVDVLFVDGKGGRLNYLRGFTRFWRRLREREYDLIHAHYIFAGMIARAQWRRPVVLTHHGPEVFITWERHLCRALTRYFDSVIVRTEEMKQRLGYNDVTIIPGGINMDKFRPMPADECRMRLGLPAGKRLILWAGEQRWEKRFELASQAMELLGERVPDVELVPLSGMPHWLVPQYMNACDALMLTSEHEGSPNVVKEAMACNLPVVATGVGDVPEIIGHTEGCHICRLDAPDLARKLEAALAFGGRTRGRDAVAHLDLETVARRIADVYERTLAARRKATAPIAITPGGTRQR